MLRVLVMTAVSFITLTSAAWGQTALGIITGHVRNEVDGQGIGASITAIDRQTGYKAFASSNLSSGYYSLILLPPGVYDLAFAAGSSYRPAAVRSVEVPVAGYVEQNVSLRFSSDVWQRGVPRSSVSRDHRTVLLFYGPDLDTSRFELVETSRGVRGSLEPSLSGVIDRGLLDNLPLAGRDVYALIALQPGAASDLATLRGPGVSLNGQRPSSSSFLLNGLENNNYLITGNSIGLPPEAVEQYRVSTNNFAAEFGRTAGYLSNGVTRRGGSEWHGMGYLYTRQGFLNAGTTGSDGASKSDLPFWEYEAGLQISGPAKHRGLYLSTLIDGLRSQSLETPATYTLPTWAFIDSLGKNTAAWRLLDKFRPPTRGGDGTTQSVALSRPQSVRRFVGLERIDWDPNDSRHITGAINISRQSEPDFFWSPYSAFISPLNSNVGQGTLGYTSTLSPRLTMEARAGMQRDLLGWNGDHPEVPRLFVQTGNVILPGSPQSYLLHNQGTGWEISANFILSRDAHNWKWGGGSLSRFLNGDITTPDGNTEFIFQDLGDFSIDKPSAVQYGASRRAALMNRYHDPLLHRNYGYNQFYGFAQDSWHATGRLLLHYGVRYDYFGSPYNSGSDKDTLIGLGDGSDIIRNLRQATFLTAPAGKQQLYAADKNDAAARVGFAVNLKRQGASILRGSYGLFYDRPFDNLWLNLRFNDAVPASSLLQLPGLDYLNQSLPALIGTRDVIPSLQRYPLALYQPGIRTPYVQSVFFGLQQRLSEAAWLEVNYAGSFGRKLLTTDLVNRQRTLCFLPGPGCRPDPAIDADLDYRGNQGSSRYHALVSSLRVRHRWGEARISYTYSHAIDNQSDPLTGLLSNNLQVTALSGRSIDLRPAGFTVQFDSSADIGNANFDQRQNLLLYSYLTLPAPGGGWRRRLLGGWSLAEVGAVRSGSPFTIYAGNTSIPFLQNRADLIAPDALTMNTGDFQGGRRLLNPDAFSNPPPGRLGNSGRNAYIGPGFFNFDLSLSRSFSVPHADRFRFILRADAYNFLNHANLGNPGGGSLFVGNEQFGVAEYGRRGSTGGLLAVTPLAEFGRQVQLMFRVSF